MSICRLCKGAGSLVRLGQPSAWLAYFTCPSCAGTGCIKEPRS